MNHYYFARPDQISRHGLKGYGVTWNHTFFHLRIMGPKRLATDLLEHFLFKSLQSLAYLP
jgi:hypothetical protein